MPPARLAIPALALLVLAAACSSRHDRPAAAPTEPPRIEATDSGFGLQVDGLVEYGRSFPLRHSQKGQGTLTVSPDGLTWRNADDSDRNFSIRNDVIKEMRLRCAARGSSSVCLELVVKTVTDLTYYFRDLNWAGGANERIRRVYDYARENYPRVTSREEMVDEID